MESSGNSDPPQQAERPGIVENLVARIIEPILGEDSNWTVFGNPVTEGGRTIVPVARVSYRFGFGGGSGTGPQIGDDSPPPGGDGGGGGGMLSARPVGYIETGSTGSRYVPVIDWSRILQTTITLTGLGLLVVLWKSLSNR